MLIIFGQRKKLKSVGALEDYCPICRSLQSFQVAEQRKVTHIYFIPLTNNPTNHFIKTCAGCNVAFPQLGDPFDHLDLGELRASGIKRLKGAAGRAELELQDSDAMDSDMRQRLLREPFVALEGWAKERSKSVALDGVAVLGIILISAALTSLLFAVLAPNSSMSPAQPYLWVVIISALACIPGLVMIGGNTRRFARKKIQPLLMRSLRPLAPSLEELHDVLTDLKRSKMMIARMIDARQLCAAIMAADERDLAMLQT